ncbi:MAG: outer membrane lipoprotein-sorting protein, partial [Myxococcota bacterium]
MRRIGCFVSWPLTLLIAATSPLSADDLGTPQIASDPLAALTGRDIYQRVLDNSFDSLIQESTLVSGDRGGNAQESRFKMWFQDLRDAEAEQPRGTIIAKTLVQYTHPFDIRYSGYLILSRRDEVNDQFVYLSSQRRVKRVNLRGEAVFGTDFSFEDILPRQIEDADYKRLGDEPANGSDCFVIEATPKDHSQSEYSRLRIYIDKQRNVPLVTRYWDNRDVEVKELRVEPK